MPVIFPAENTSIYTSFEKTKQFVRKLITLLDIFQTMDNKSLKCLHIYSKYNESDKRIKNNNLYYKAHSQYKHIPPPQKKKSFRTYRTKKINQKHITYISKMI